MKENKKNAVFAVLIGLAAVALFVNITMRYMDTDLWYLLNTGCYILKNGIPSENPFITTPGQPMIIQNWAWCVIIAIADKYAGVAGLVLLNGLVVIACCVVGMLFLNVTGIKSKNPVAIALKALFVLMAINAGAYPSLRPEMLTTALILVQCIAMEKYKQDGKVRYLFALPVIAIAEANLHCSYLAMHAFFALVYLIPVPFLDIKKGCISGKKRLVVIDFLGASLLTSLINPYGVNAIAYVFRAFFKGHLTEWNIIEISSASIRFPGFGEFLIVIAVVTLLIFKKKISAQTLLIASSVTLLYFVTVKWVAFLTIVLLYLAKDAVNVAKISEIFAILAQNKLFKWLLPAVTVILVALNIASINKKDDIMPQGFLNDAYEYIKDKDNPSVCCYNFALCNYFEYRGIKVYLDARPELYEGEISETYLSLLYLKNIKDENTPPLSLAESEEIINLIGTDYFVVEVPGFAVIGYILEVNPCYELVESVSTDEYLLYEKVQ